MFLKIWSLILLLAILPSFSCIDAASDGTIADGSSILIYTDALYQKGFKNVKKVFREVLDKKDIDWSVKKSKYDSYVELASHVEKALLRRKADHVILALGIEGLWDSKGEQASEQSLDDYAKAIQSIVEQLQAAEVGVSLCTPHQLMAGRSEAANKHMHAAADKIREIAKSADLVLIDLYESFAEKNKTEDPGKYFKGITTKDGVKLNKTGDEIVASCIAKAFHLTKGGAAKIANLGREPAKGDVYLFLCPAGFKRIVKNLGADIKEHYRETMSVEAPRVTHVTWDQQIFKTSPGIDVIAASNADAIIIFPGSGVIDAKGRADSLLDGSFRAAMRQRIEDIQAVIKAPVFLCTPLLYVEAGNKTVIGGQNFKNCQLWASETRAVANELDLAVIDLNKACLEYVNKNGVEGVFFAGRTRDGVGLSDIELTAFNMNFVHNAFSRVLNFKSQK